MQELSVDFASQGSSRQRNCRRRFEQSRGSNFVWPAAVQRNMRVRNILSRVRPSWAIAAVVVVAVLIGVVAPNHATPLPGTVLISGSGTDFTLMGNVTGLAPSASHACSRSRPPTTSSAIPSR